MSLFPCDPNVDKYALPVPFIGLYIAAASLVCLLMMIYDIVKAVRARQRWIPCKAFTLNSVTLTLLSIATKIPVDLTSPMTSRIDQLSKLSGTTLVCISVGFLYPSIGVLSRSESFSNLVSLTILVVIIIANICIQLFTGLIALFIVEHIIILCCMFILLLMSWFFYWLVDAQRTSFVSVPSVNENRSLFTWLKNLNHIFFSSNPQILACMEQTSVAVTIICSLSTIIFILAAVRFLVHDQNPPPFCFLNIYSDYGRTVWLIFIIQTLIVVVGILAICSRLVAFSKLLVWDHRAYRILRLDAYRTIKENPILGSRASLYGYSMFLKHYSLRTLGMVRSIITFLPRHVLIFSQGDNVFQRIKEWEEQKAMEDLERWRGKGTNESVTPLSKLLSKTYPPPEFPLELSEQSMHGSDLVGVNSLSIVVLVRIAQVFLPDNLSGLIVQAFIEVKEIFHYIENYTRPGIEGSDKVLVLARAVWEGAEFSCLLSKPLDKTTFGSSPDDLGVAIDIIQKLEWKLPFDEVRREVSRVAKTILDIQRYSSIEELGGNIQHLFVEMLRMMLAQLPTVVCKSISDCPSEEYEERIKVACQHLYKVEHVEHQIQWEWPEGYKFSSLINEEENDETSKSISTEEGNVSIEDSIVEDPSNNIPIVCAHDGDVVVQVE